MTTLIAAYNSDGCIGRCDAKCYEAHHPDCDCICGGRNHGAGKNQAMANTSELAQQWIDEYSKQHNLGDDVKFEIPGAQLTMPI